jgi:hypothetical protein
VSWDVCMLKRVRACVREGMRACMHVCMCVFWVGRKALCNAIVCDGLFSEVGSKRPVPPDRDVKRPNREVKRPNRDVKRPVPPNRDVSLYGRSAGRQLRVFSHACSVFLTLLSKVLCHVAAYTFFSARVRACVRAFISGCMCARARSRW